MAEEKKSSTSNEANERDPNTGIDLTYGKNVLADIANNSPDFRAFMDELLKKGLIG